jgi:hypothetical protein
MEADSAPPTLLLSRESSGCRSCVDAWSPRGAAPSARGAAQTHPEVGHGRDGRPEPETHLPLPPVSSG